MNRDGAVACACAALCWVALTSCGGASASGPSVNIPALVVESAGQAPRQRLQYAPSLHAVERVEMEFKLTLGTSYENTVLEEGERNLELPTIRAVGHLEVTSVEPDGAAKVAYTMEEAERVGGSGNPAVLATVDWELRAVRKFRAAWRVSRSGMVSDVVVDPSFSSNRFASLVESMRDAVIVFPLEPVGVGASWKLTTTALSSGIHWTRTTSYVLRAFSAGTATVDVTQAARAESQALHVEPNATTRLTSARADGTGVALARLTALMPSGTFHSFSEANLLIVSKRLRIRSAVRAAADLTISSTDAADPSTSELPSSDPR